MITGVEKLFIYWLRRHNLLIGEATGADLTGALGQGVEITKSRDEFEQVNGG